jgi:hypothetical protein
MTSAMVDPTTVGHGPEVVAVSPGTATITRLIITVEEQGTSPLIHTLPDGGLVSDSADITPIVLGSWRRRRVSSRSILAPVARHGS